MSAEKEFRKAIRLCPANVRKKGAEAKLSIIFEDDMLIIRKA